MMQQAVVLYVYGIGSYGAYSFYAYSVKGSKMWSGQFLSPQNTRAPVPVNRFSTLL